MRSTLTVLGLMLVALLSLSVPAYGAASTKTIHFSNATQILPFGNPCSGVAGVFTITYDGVAHVTNNAAGGSHATMTLHGGFTIAQVNGVTFTGHFTLWSGQNAQVTSSGGAESGFTAIWIATGSDGTTLKFHVVSHITVNPNGVVTSNFFNLKCF